MTDWLDGNPGLAVERPWPMAPAHLLARERWLWWDTRRVARRALQRLAGSGLVGGWSACRGAGRAVAWVGRYDSSEWDDPPGKLSLLYYLERGRHAQRQVRLLCVTSGRPSLGASRSRSNADRAGRRTRTTMAIVRCQMDR